MYAIELREREKAEFKTELEKQYGGYLVLYSGETRFNVDDVKLKRRVIAPYRKSDGQTKDWNVENEDKYRLTHP